MQAIESYVPGEPTAGDAVAERLRWPIPGGVAKVCVDAYTEPGETVLIPYCQGPTEVREVVEAGRRVLAVHFDPAVMLAVQDRLLPSPPREVDAATARLGDSPKQGQPLRYFLSNLYATTCPACGRTTVAEAFLWEGEPAQPAAKRIHCADCGYQGEAGLDAEDHERQKEMPAQGLHVHYVLDRAVPDLPASPLRARLRPWLELYSPRNLYALSELTLRIDGQIPPGRALLAHQALLLECLETCSRLPPLSPRHAGRPLAARSGPAAERNVWLAFEEAAARRRAAGSAWLHGLAATPEEFLADGSAAQAFVGRLLVRDLVRLVPQRSLRLILFSPPPLNASAWSLSCFWTGWVLGPAATTPLRPLVRSRTPDPAWFAGAMAGSLRSLAGFLRDDGRLVLVLSGQRREVLEALVLAAASVRLSISSLVQSGASYRLELTPQAAGPVVPAHRSASAPYPDLEDQICRVAVEAAADAIRARGEPVPDRTFHAAVQRTLATRGWLAVLTQAQERLSAALILVRRQTAAAREDPALVRLEGAEGRGELWWLSQPRNLAPALADRVEAAVYDLLCQVPLYQESAFLRAVHSRFPGVLAPSPGLVAACLSSYAQQVAPSGWRLHPGDQAASREAEREGMVAQLLALGRRLGYRAAPWPPFDLAWWKDGQVHAAFVVRWQALLGEVLALAERAPGVRLSLVIPGGRSGLVSYKLAHNPIWQRAVEECGWRLLKYRHVRELLAQPGADEEMLRTIAGLDPIVDREPVQLALF